MCNSAILRSVVITQGVGTADTRTNADLKAQKTAHPTTTFYRRYLALIFPRSVKCHRLVSCDISLYAGTVRDYPVYEDRDTFYAALAAFTDDGDNARFASDIRYNDDGEIGVSTFNHYVRV